MENQKVGLRSGRIFIQKDDIELSIAGQDAGETSQNIGRNVCGDKDTGKDDQNPDQFIEKIRASLAKRFLGKIIISKPRMDDIRAFHNHKPDKHDKNSKGDADEKRHMREV